MLRVARCRKGKILVVVRGSCPFSTKAENAAAAGAVGLVVVDNCSPMMEVNTNCDAKNAPIMSIEAGKAMDSAVYDMVALAVTEQVGISLLTLAMLDAGNVMATIEKNDHPARLTVASDATPQPGVPPHPPRTDDDGHDDKHRNSTSMFGTFVLFSGCITIGMLGQYTTTPTPPPSFTHTHTPLCLFAATWARVQYRGG